MDKQDVELIIEKLSAKGRGIASFNSSKVEVIGALPGEKVRVQMGRKRKGKSQASSFEILTPSPFRQAPKCPHSPLCGGCSLQHLDYEAQLREKQTFIEKTFAPLLQASSVTLHPIIPCKGFWQYRNKMEFSFSQNLAKDPFLGLMIAGARSKVLNLEECHLTAPWFIKVLSSVREFWKESGLSAYHMSDRGSLRTLTLREGKKTQDKMAMLTVSGNPAYSLTRKQLDAFVQAVKRALPDNEHERLSIFLRIQQIAKGHPTQFYEMHLHGPDHIKEILEVDDGTQSSTLTFKISPTSFFQPNTLQTQILYSRALQMLKLSPTSTVYDLYCGTCTIGLAMAKRVKQVIGIELNPHAIFDAKVNQELNQIQNIQLFCGDVGKILKEHLAQPGFTPPDVAIVDPPRTGLDPAALSALLALQPRQILYISCNPSTQVQNLLELTSAGYQLLELQPVDQFPHTMHIENIAILKKK